MKTIWKFPLSSDNRQRVKMPMNAEILCAHIQDETLCVWAHVETTSPAELRTIEIFATGEPIPEGMGQSRRYIDTFQVNNGSLIFHVFEYTGM